MLCKCVANAVSAARIDWLARKPCVSLFIYYLFLMPDRRAFQQVGQQHNLATLVHLSANCLVLVKIITLPGRCRFIISREREPQVGLGRRRVAAGLPEPVFAREQPISG